METGMFFWNKENKQSKKTQLGSTIVEMLTVLVIIGILSMIGLSGYYYTTGKVRASNIVKELKMRAASISTDAGFSLASEYSELTARGFDNYKDRLTYSQIKVSASQFKITISDIPKDLCLRMADIYYPEPYRIEVNELASEGKMPDKSRCGGDMNKIAFFYDAFVIARPDPD